MAEASRPAAAAETRRGWKGEEAGTSMISTPSLMLATGRAGL